MMILVPLQCFREKRGQKNRNFILLNMDGVSSNYFRNLLNYLIMYTLGT